MPPPRWIKGATWRNSESWSKIQTCRVITYMDIFVKRGLAGLGTKQSEQISI